MAMPMTIIIRTIITTAIIMTMLTIIAIVTTSHRLWSTILLEQNVLAKNAALAARNRAWFAGREILALNLVSGPGAGKTTLLERTVQDLRHTLSNFRHRRRPGHDQ